VSGAEPTAVGEEGDAGDLEFRGPHIRRAGGRQLQLLPVLCKHRCGPPAILRGRCSRLPGDDDALVISG